MGFNSLKIHGFFNLKIRNETYYENGDSFTEAISKWSPIVSESFSEPSLEEIIKNDLDSEFRGEGAIGITGVAIIEISDSEFQGNWNKELKVRAMRPTDAQTVSCRFCYGQITFRNTTFCQHKGVHHSLTIQEEFPQIPLTPGWSIL